MAVEIEELQKQVDELRADFNLFRQATNKNIYSNLIVFIKKVLFRGDIKTIRNKLEYNLVPTYIEVAEGGSSSVGGTGSWEDWDLSSIIPAGALRADISIVNRFDVEYLAGVRQNGSSQERRLYISNDSQTIMTVNLDEDRVVERYSTNANVSFAVRGYYI